MQSARLFAIRADRQIAPYFYVPNATLCKPKLLNFGKNSIPMVVWQASSGQARFLRLTNFIVSGAAAEHFP
jgi:hypothetical protein